jgi:hypothetical protein
MKVTVFQDVPHSVVEGCLSFIGAVSVIRAVGL